jgi:6,7-dimethyl-8-ribityllumazine synthase
MKVHKGTLDARDLRVAVIASRFNETLSKQLVDGALDQLVRLGVPEEEVTLVWVPGAFEIPVTASRLARTGRFDALVCLGVVIRGETAHFEYVAGHASNGVGQVALSSDLPIANGILTTETVEQAADRSGGKMGNKGAEAAQAAVEMASLFAELPKPISEV